MTRGFAAIGLSHPKRAENVGGVLRAAHAYGAAMVAIAGDRSPMGQIKSAPNTSKAHRHMPIMRGIDLRGMIPCGAVPVAVDILDGAIALPNFIHPESAFYIFGPEDGTLGKNILNWCPFRVMIPTQFCMNLAATVNVVLYDRMAKAMARQIRSAA